MNYVQEYFCPHCGAILNDQPGFDPDNGTWICTECGQMLMDDDISNSDTYEGIAWFCDNCGALLNRQVGFSDSYGSWTCTECGHVNGTTDHDIINGFKCPKCGATLDVQSGFNKYDDDWECTECGAHLHHSYSDDEYEEVEEPKHRCPNCDAPLDIQWGYNEYDDYWKCTECGAKLHHSYSDDDYTVIKHVCPNCDAPLDIQWGYNEYDDYWECTECGAHLHHDYSDEEYSIVEDEEENSYEDKESDSDEEESEDNSGYSGYSYSFEDRRTSESNKAHRTYQSPTRPASSTYSEVKLKKKKSGWFGIILLLLMLLGAAGYMGRDYFTTLGDTESHLGEVKLTYSASAYEDENYYNAIIKILKQGLSNIRLTPLNDLKSGIFSGDGKKEGIIETIEIAGISDFQSGTWVDAMSVVSITYHSFEKTEKNGYDPSKNNHSIINGIDIALPMYLVNDTQGDGNATYHDKGDEEAQFLVSFDSQEEWTDIKQYDTYYVLKQENRWFSEMSGEEMIALGKMNDKVYLIQAVTADTKTDSEYLHIVMKVPDTSRADYSSDFKAILSGIYIPKESEIRIDFTIKDYKGDNYNDVVSALESKGFKNVKVENLQDVVLGIFAKDGIVESVFIDGKDDYKVGDWISNQSEVIVTYHGKK
ncbi:MAG: hypothetical protein K6F23_10230 [Solobacterium sp.]|nr:hypothetical protein [Solobacterium sp.]